MNLTFSKSNRFHDNWTDLCVYWRACPCNLVQPLLLDIHFHNLKSWDLEKMQYKSILTEFLNRQAGSRIGGGADLLIKQTWSDLTGEFGEHHELPQWGWVEAPSTESHGNITLNLKLWRKSAEYIKGYQQPWKRHLWHGIFLVISALNHELWFRPLKARCIVMIQWPQFKLQYKQLGMSIRAIIINDSCQHSKISTLVLHKSHNLNWSQQE